MNRQKRRYIPRGALRSLGRLKLLLERITKDKKNKAELIYGVYGSDVQRTNPILFYYIHLDTGSYIDRTLTLHTYFCQDDCTIPGNGQFDLKHWNVVSKRRSNCFLFENYFFALAYKLQCEHDQQTGR